jgi:hypothetical protein
LTTFVVVAVGSFEDVHEAMTSAVAMTRLKRILMDADSIR